MKLTGTAYLTGISDGYMYTSLRRRAEFLDHEEQQCYRAGVTIGEFISTITFKPARTRRRLRKKWRETVNL